MAVTFELFTDARGRFRFHVRHVSGEIIATSGSFESRAEALAAVESGEVSPGGELVSQTA